MLNFEDVVNSYPKNLQGFKENILKEYLQYKILDILFSIPISQKLVFMGGACLRIVYDSQRFSEDLDFDLRGKSFTAASFGKLAQLIQRGLEKEGYLVEIKNVYKNAYHCYIKFPGILFEQDLLGYKEEKILIRVDAQPQHYSYQPAQHFINKFGIYRMLRVTPEPLLLSQKIGALLGRSKEKGRDFFDVVYLMGRIQPDYKFLKKYFKITSREELIASLKEKAKILNFKQLANDVTPFLFDPGQKDRVLYFREWLETL